MDILVTTPISEIDNSKKEGELIEKEGGFWFRTFRFKPQVEINDKIYFVEKGLITGYSLIFEISKLAHSFGCDVTGRNWGKKGSWVVKYKDWHWLKSPIPFSGFQGIRYIDRLAGLKEQLTYNQELK